MHNLHIITRGKNIHRIYIRYHEYTKYVDFPVDEISLSGIYEISNFLKLDLNQYKDLIKQYNGKIRNNFTTFDTKEDASEFIKIIENIILMNQIGGLYNN